MKAMVITVDLNIVLFGKLIELGKGKVHRWLVTPGSYMKALCTCSFIRAYIGERNST